MKNRIALFLLIFTSLLWDTSCKKTPNTTPLFTTLPAAQTGITFQNDVPDQEGLNIIEYLYYYNGGGVAVGDINNDGKPDIYFSSNLGSNKLYLNKGDFKFEDITDRSGTKSSGTWKTGVTMVDVNGDGWLDIYICTVSKYRGNSGRLPEMQGQNQLLINNHDGTFTDKAADYGLNTQGFCTQAAFFDFDGDGDLDMYLLRHSVHSPRSYRNVSARMDKDERAGDILFRNDSDPSTFASHNNHPYFVDISAQAGIHDGSLGYGLGIAIGDVNGDGLPDIYVGNDFHDNDYLYYNNGNGTFSEAIEASMAHTSNFSMGNDLADFNNDGMLDFVGLDMKPEEESLLKSYMGADAFTIYNYKHNDFGFHFQFPRNSLQLNRGNLSNNATQTQRLGAARAQIGETNTRTANGLGTKSDPINNYKNTAQFSEIGQLVGMEATNWSWSALLADLDNDGNKDLYITNGITRRPDEMDFNKFLSDAKIQKTSSNLELIKKMPAGLANNYCYQNKGNLQFENASEKWGLNQFGVSNGAAYADLDGDGDLDLVVNNSNAPASILKNETFNQKQAIKDQPTINNHNFLTIKLNGEGMNTQGIGAKVTLYTNSTLQYQEMQPTRGFQSSVEPILHFGLGKTNQVDSLTITWRDGKTQTLKSVQANQKLIFKQADAKPTSKITPPKSIPLFTTQSPPNYKHTASQFSDADRQKLIPHYLSTEGPKLAVGDINGDGVEDFYVGGTTAHAGAMFLGNKPGGYNELPDWNISPSTTPNEDIGAIFFDADGDKDLDLYLVSGGGNAEGEQDPKMQDRLYLNDGKGHFISSKEALPPFFHNGSCVRAADIDGDGDLDLFVGSRSDMKTYGLSPRSYLLQNDGKGHFKDITTSFSPELVKIGMVTDALFADLNGDKLPDLVVVGEWMPITICYNQAGKQFSCNPIENTTGWWNCIAAADMDADGNIDLVAGNLGLNSNLKASIKEPLKLYVKDFDKNGDQEPILSYYRQGKEYCFGTKDELTAQMPSLKKRYLDYKPFANSTLDQVFPEAARKDAVVKKAELMATVFLKNTKGKTNTPTWQINPLPLEAQYSTTQSILIEDFDKDGNLDILIGGNFHEFLPAIGSQDASFGSLLKGDGKANFTSIENKKTGLYLTGAIRDIKRVGKQIIITANNKSLQILNTNTKESY
jgi:enediyne biosynthesis protein E4